MRAGPRSAADRGPGQFMSPNACAVVEVLMAKGFDARWRFHRNGSPRFAPGRRPAMRRIFFPLKRAICPKKIGQGK